jgi:hypothetical protein
MTDNLERVLDSLLLDGFDIHQTRMSLRKVLRIGPVNGPLCFADHTPEVNEQAFGSGHDAIRRTLLPAFRTRKGIRGRFAHGRLPINISARNGF